MRRFYIPATQIQYKNAMIQGSDAHHLVNVLNYQIGDKLEATDGQGSQMTVEIKSIQEGHVEVEILDKKEVQERYTEITLFQAIPKGNIFDAIVAKACELGIARIYPMVTERSIVHLSDERGLKKIARWERVALETQKKMGRTSILSIHPVINIKELSRYSDPKALKIVPWEVGEKPLKTILQENKSTVKIQLLIGPEGGISTSEVESLQKLGFLPASLGKRILTVETAAITAIANCYYEFENQ